MTSRVGRRERASRGDALARRRPHCVDSAADTAIYNTGKRDDINPIIKPSTTIGSSDNRVCFPSFEPPSPDERQAGLTGHGSYKPSSRKRWRRHRSERRRHVLLRLRAAENAVPDHADDHARTGEAEVDVAETIDPSRLHRPYNWNQHETFGAPFVTPRDLSSLGMSASAGVTDRERTATVNGSGIGRSCGRPRRVLTTRRSPGGVWCLTRRAKPAGKPAGRLHRLSRI